MENRLMVAGAQEAWNREGLVIEVFRILAASPSAACLCQSTVILPNVTSG